MTNNLKITQKDWIAKFKQRQKKVVSSISGEAMLLFSETEKKQQNDTNFPFIQDSSFFYLTGFSEPNSALLLLGRKESPKSILFVKDKDPLKERWEGKLTGIKKLKKSKLYDEVFSIESLEAKLPKLLSGSSKLHSILGISKKHDGLILKQITSQASPRFNAPCQYSDARLLLADHRHRKDSLEITAIKEAARISAAAFKKVISNISNFDNEINASKYLELEFYKGGAERPAFPTIVASGGNATCLHYSPSSTKFKKNELILIDAGASFNGYAADISRTFPYGDKFTKAQAQLYDAVYNAHEAALKAAKPGSSLFKIHQAACKSLTIDLKKLGLLKGSLKTLLEKKSYQKFYMHGTGHWLGLDVHDIGPADYSKPFKPQPSQKAPLKAGNVFTIEPGLYLDKDDKSIPKEFRGIGIRLENDILITNTSAEILSKGLPYKREEIEKLRSKD